MLVRDRIALLQEGVREGLPSGCQPRLPVRLKSDQGVRPALLMRLAASRNFALGDRSGVLSAAQRRSGRGFRLDVRQRVVVKALVSRHVGRGGARSAALAAHVAYLGRRGAGQEGERPDFFNRDGAVDPRVSTAGWSRDRHHFRLIISPEHGDRIRDLPSYVRDVMGRVRDDLGEGNLSWIAVCHFDTAKPHAHVLLRGRRADGRDLVLPRDYIAYGLRARAQEAAQERLGDLSLIEAEARVWRQTRAHAFTALDRRLLSLSDAGGWVEDGLGGRDAWSALSRGRLRTLEALGLAERSAKGFVLDAQMEQKLRRLGAHQDVIRSLNERRLETGTTVRILQGRLHGRVMKTGRHDEIGTSPWAIVRDDKGQEFYAPLMPGGETPKIGQDVVMERTAGGAARLLQARSAGASLE